MKEFIIPFFGLKIGNHEFDFKIGESFFEAFESNLIENATFDVVLKLTKSANMLQLDFKAKGKIADFCDRCGDPLDVPVKTTDRLFVKFGNEAYEQTDEVLVVTNDTHEIDVSQYIYEMLVLGIPGRRVHKKTSDCNQEVLNKLKALETDEEPTTDPRWDALKKLK
jgi:uncharacterized metal-binding protein YceD (DUF177 family)